MGRAHAGICDQLAGPVGLAGLRGLHSDVWWLSGWVTEEAGHVFLLFQEDSPGLFTWWLTEFQEREQKVTPRLRTDITPPSAAFDWSKQVTRLHLRVEKETLTSGWEEVESGIAKESWVQLGVENYSCFYSPPPWL